jgi:hypothetical protein
LNQLVRLVHPRYIDDRAGLIRYVLDGRKAEATGVKQKVVEELKALPKGQEKIIANTMIDNSIPWDVVKGFAGLKGEIATASMTQMGLTALLLNIRSLDQHGVFSSDGGLTALKMKMNEVKNGRSIPLDFAKPYIHTKNMRVKDILLSAMVDVLDVDMGVVEGLDVAVSVDISGSMSGETLQTAGLLSIPFLKAKSLWFTTFDTGLYEEGVDKRGGVNIWGYSYGGFCPKINGLVRKDQVKNLLSMQTGGGTDTSQPIVHAIRQNRKIDVFVLITDEQQNSGRPLMTAWKKYRANVNKNAKLWIVNATNYEWHAADFGDPSVTIYQTITPALFRNLDYIGQDPAMAIKKFDLKSFAEKIG